MKRRKKLMVLMILIVAFVSVGFYALTSAKYIYDSALDYYLRSKGFYLSSDELGSTTINNTDNNWNGGSVYFNIKNNLNTSVITDYDINYLVTCTVKGDAANYSTCHVNGTALDHQDGVLLNTGACNNTKGDNVNVSAYNKTQCAAGGYDWVSQISTNDIYFDVILTDSNHTLSDVVVGITLTSTAPYHKTLSGDFTLHKSNIDETRVSMSYENYSNYDRLIVSNANSTTKCVQVTWNPTNILINEDTSRFSSYGNDANGYINQIKFNIGAKKSLSYIFYRKDFDITYTVSEFTLTNSTGC